MWEIYSCFQRDKEGPDCSFVPAIFQVTLIQNSQYATLAYFGAACPEPQHI